jgi:hypothetical protein
MALAKAEMERQLEESILVAQSAVTAAERREAKLVKERTVILQNLQVHKQEKEFLLDRITRLEKQLVDQELTIDTMRNASINEKNKSKDSPGSNSSISVEILSGTQSRQELGNRREVIRTKRKTFLKVFRPGRMGDFVKQSVRSMKKLRPFIQRWMDRIPFQIIRKH